MMIVTASWRKEELLFNENVCPKGCEPELFENSLQLRERRLDLEELLAEEKSIAKSLKKESDMLIKKDKLGRTSRQAVETDVELINQEKQLKMDELDVVVPLRLDQVIQKQLITDEEHQSITEVFIYFYHPL
ncbi:hypothetical protein ILYODFUR_005963 [Ilyodon furcidens]|uniref:Uncharacterized protein n=1 Tax=Ilyodon furcidens TaxID=33524 RepID=A0ABV0V1Q6_9TELE